MKNIKYFLSAVLIVSVVGMISGCSPWTQDPLANKSGLLKDPVNEPTSPESPKAKESDLVRLEPQYFAFNEGQAAEVAFVARILEEDYAAEIRIQNPNDFPGAVLDSAGKFSWTPAIGTIPADKDTKETRKLKLVVIGRSTKNSNAVEYTRGFEIPIDITKVAAEPQIFSISESAVTLREGERKSIQLGIRDRDAGTDTKSWPVLNALPMLGQKSLSQFIKLESMLAVGKGEFTARIIIDLTNAELTKSKDQFGFALQAVSRLNKGSVTQNVVANVTTSFSQAQSTWFDFVEAPLGQKTNFQFMIFDPKDELMVEEPIFSGGPNGVTIKCSRLNITRQLCKLEFSPDLTVVPGEYIIRASTTLRNQDNSDSYTQPQSFDLKFRVTDVAPVSQKVGR